MSRKNYDDYLESSGSDKPQGFTIGKLRNQGWYSCPYGCNLLFSHKTEAKNHEGCQGRKDCDDKIAKLHQFSAKTFTLEDILRSVPVEDMNSRVRKFIESIGLP